MTVQQRMGIALGTALLLTLLAGVTGFVSWPVIGFAIGAAVIVLLVYLAWEHNIRTEFSEELSQTQRRSLNNAYSEHELRERIIEWSKSFPQDDVITFHPNDYKAESVPLLWEDQEHEELWYFYSSFGFNNKPIVVFIEGTTGEIKGRKSLMTEGQKRQVLKDPFQYCDRYNEFREHRRQRTRRHYGRNRSQTQTDDDSGESETLPLSEGDPRGD